MAAISAKNLFYHDVIQPLETYVEGFFKPGHENHFYLMIIHSPHGETLAVTQNKAHSFALGHIIMRLEDKNPKALGGRLAACTFDEANKLYLLLRNVLVRTGTLLEQLQDKNDVPDLIPSTQDQHLKLHQIFTQNYLAKCRDNEEVKKHINNFLKQEE